MTAYYFIYALVLCGVPLSLIDNIRTRRLTQMFYFGCMLSLLILFAGLRSPYVDRDYSNYVDWFNGIRAGALGAHNLNDPAFALISIMVLGMGLTYAAVAFIYAAISLLVQMHLVNYAVNNRWLTLFFYLLFCEYYIVGVMTEIRAMVAIPLMVISICLSTLGRKTQSIIVCIIALAFHASVIAALPVLILILLGVKFRSKLWVLAFVPVTFIGIFSVDSVVKVLVGLDVQRIIAASSADNDYSHGSWNALVCLAIILASLLFAWKRMSFQQRTAVVCSSLGLSLMVIFRAYAELGIRIMYIFEIWWLFLLSAFMDMMRGNKRILYLVLLVIFGYGLYRRSLTSIDHGYTWLFAIR